MSENRLRVMTFNILVDRRNDPPFDWISRRSQIVSIVKKYQPDICCFQEALEHQKLYLLNALDDYESFGVGRNDGLFEGEQVPIYHRRSSFQLCDQGYFWLSTMPHNAGSIGWDAKRPRTAVWKKLIHHESNRRILVINTHFDHKGQYANCNSIEVIQKCLPEVEADCAVILCGDFNSSEQTAAYSSITKAGFVDAVENAMAHGQGPNFSYHRFMMKDYEVNATNLMREHDRIFRAIDHVFYMGDITILRYDILNDHLNGVYPSDHFPVLCDVLV